MQELETIIEDAFENRLRGIDDKEKVGKLLPSSTQDRFALPRSVMVTGRSING